jgi:phosphoribosylanthranilate isomerase
MGVGVKICGITGAEDARVAAEAGADALGFVFAPSPRRVTPDQVRAILRSLQARIVPVGVFVSEPAREIAELARACRIPAVQVHRPLGPEEHDALAGLFIVQAWPIGSAADVEAACRAPCHALLLDANVGALAGGSGRSFDWTLLEGRRFKRPLVLAGGLTPANVEEAIRRVRPDAVDVSSGVESAPGIKDPVAVRDFVRRAKSK